MAALNHIEKILCSLNPLEIVEMCMLDCDPDDLVYALGDWIEEHQDEIEGLLIQAGLLEEDE